MRISDCRSDMCAAALPRELVARIKAIFRRVATGGLRQHGPDSASYAFDTWVLKSGERTLVDSEGVALPLSTAEYNLMLAFVTRPNQVLSRDQLLDITQGRSEEHTSELQSLMHISYAV